LRTAALSPLVLVLLTSACAGGEAATAPTPAGEVPQSPGARVEVAVVQASAAKLDIRLPGEVTGSRDALLAAPAGGFVERVVVEPGASVSQGQALAYVNSGIFAAQYEQAAAQATLARSELERVRAMGDLASKAQLQGAETQHAIAQANLKMAAIQASRAVIKAPFDGTVTQIDLEVGEVVNPGQPVARVVALDPIHVTVSVADRDVGLLKPGMPVMVSADAAAGSFQGVVHNVDLAADLESRSFLSKVQLPNPDRQLLPGMIATVAIAADLGGEAIVLPQDWLVTGTQGTGVFVDREGKAAWQPVRAGALVHDQVVVAEGVTAGDRVIYVGHRSLAEGDPLIVSREGVCCEAGRVIFNR
jgi:membrane fusion protein (multidrug efflux system)